MSEPAPRRLSTLDLPPEHRKHRITTARAFMSALFDERAREVARQSDRGAFMAGSSQGAMLERAQLYTCTSRVIGYGQDAVPVYERIPGLESGGSDGCMAVHETRSTSSGFIPKTSGFLAALEQVWSSLTTNERAAVSYDYEMSADDAVAAIIKSGVLMSNGLPPTRRWLKRVLEDACHAIESHPLFARLREGIEE